EYASPARVGELGNRIGTVGLPNRRGRQGVERVMLMAVAEGLRIQVRYWSVNSGKASWRWLRPHAFGHDGYRWHVRAWCEQREKFLDFVLGRIEKTEWPDGNDEDKKKLPVDEDWQRVVVVKVRANGMLSEQAQRAIELDYGIRKKGGVLKLKVRKAMEGYLLDHLRIGREGGDLPRHFELCDE
ncbi:MAG: WYL domain-containing protein, partial [Akkermansiaceae bacterium]